MRHFLLILVLLCCCSMAHAASCTGSAQCVSVQYGGGGGSNVSTVSIAYSPSNTATNTLIAFVYLNCATSWGSLSDVSFQDSNGNSWDHNWMSETIAGPTSEQQLYFGWAVNVASGSNTVTMNIANHTDCQVIAAAYEYAGIVPIYSGGASDQIIVNVNGNTFGSGSNTFPVSTSGGGGSSANLQLTFSVHDTGNTGTFGISAGGGAVWNSIGTFSGSGGSQVASWDGGLGGPPQTVTVSNTGGSGYSTAVILSIVLNRSTPVPPPTPAPGTLVNYRTCNYVTSGSSTTCTFNSPQNPDVAFISSWNYGHGGRNIISVSGCGVNWEHTYVGDFNGSGQDVYVATDLTTSTCSVTVTFDSAITDHGNLIAQGEYIGVPAMPIAYFPEGDSLSINIPGAAGVTMATYPFVTYEPNDILVMIGGSFNDCGFLGSTGGTALTSHTALRAPDPGCGQNNLGIIQVMDATIPTVGSYSTTVANNEGASSYFYPMIIRSQMPSGPAVTQRIPCTTTGNVISSLVCTPMTARSDASQEWVVFTSSANVDATLTDSEGTCVSLPSEWGNAEVGLAYLCKDSSLTLPTFTLSSATNLDHTDMVVEGIQGVNGVFSLYSGHAWSDVYHTNVGPNINTFDVGPISVPGGQCFLLLSFSGGPSNIAVTQTAGYNLRGSWPINYGQNLQYSYDQQVCPSSLTSGYDNVFTYPSPHGQLEGGTWALGQFQNTSFPVVAQTLPAQFVGSSGAAPFFGPVSAGDVITVCAVGNSASALTISSTPTLTWHLGASGGPSDIYSAWYATKPSTGSLSVQVSGTFGAGGFIDTVLLDNRFITAFDAVNSGYAGTSGNLSTGNISTTANHDWLVSCALSVDDTTASFALPTNDLWSLNQYYPTDGGYSDSWTMVAGAPGTYSNTFDFIQNQPNAAVIFGFTTSIPTPLVQPNAHVTIALNGAKLPAFEIGAR